MNEQVLSASAAITLDGRLDGMSGSAQVRENGTAQVRAVLEEQWRRHVADIVELSLEICDQQACDRDQPDGAAVRATAQLVAAQRLTLREIEAALERVESGRYGICEGCGDPIQAARLEVLPHTRYCVTCQPSRERRSAGRSPAVVGQRAG